MSLVTLTDVVKTFGETVAVDSASFSIDRGEVVGFLGPNGAGKTTTMRLITQYLEPDGGTISIDGLSIDEHPVELRRRIGYLPETNPLYRDMLAGEYITYMGRLRGMGRDEIRTRTDDVVAQTGIEAVYYRPINQLSKGYRQRVGLAQAILSQPEILILDEPTEGLDPNQRVEIRSLIRDVGSDRTVLLSTHVMQEVRKTCSRVVIINGGRIVADGSVDALVAGQGGARVIVELAAPAAEARQALGALSSVATVDVLDGPTGSDAADSTHDPAASPDAADTSPDAVNAATDTAPDDARAAPGSSAHDRRRFAVEGATGDDPRAHISALAAARGWPLWELHLAQASLEDLFHRLTVTSAEAAGSPDTELGTAVKSDEEAGPGRGAKGRTDAATDVAAGPDGDAGAGAGDGEVGR